MAAIIAAMGRPGNPRRPPAWRRHGNIAAGRDFRHPSRPIDLHRLRSEHPDVRVIDVRTPGEFAGRHIPGSYNVPLPDLAEHRAELTSPDAGPVVLVCESGGRYHDQEQPDAAP